MPAWLQRTWVNLGLQHRIALVLGTVWLGAAGLLFGVATYQHRAEAIQEDEAKAQRVLLLISPLLAEQALLGDYAAIKQLLERQAAMYREISSLRWHRPGLADISVAVNAPAEQAPPWFQILVDVPGQSQSRQIQLGGVGYGELQVALDPGVATHELWREFQTYLLLAIAATAGGLPLLMLLVRANTRALRQLSEAADHIRKGEYAARIPVEGAREVRTTAQAFNGMAERMEALLKEVGDSEARFRALVETTPDWVWEVDAHGVYTYASPRIRDLLGLEPEAVLGRMPFDLMTEEEAQRVGPLFTDIVASRRPFSGLENTNLHRDGRKVVLETSGVPIFDEAGEFMGYRGVDRDISERKAAEERIRLDREQQTALRELQEIVLADEAVEDTLLHCLDHMLSISWLALLPKGAVLLADHGRQSLHLAAFRDLAPEEIEPCQRVPFGKCLCGKAAITGKVQFADRVDESHVITYPGMADHGHYCVPFVSGSRVMGVLVIYLPPGTRHDPMREEFLTSVGNIMAAYLVRKEAENALLKHQESLEKTVAERTALVERQARIIDQSHDSVVTTDLDGLITTWNHGAERLFGFTAEEVVGKPISIVYPPEEHEFLRRQVIQPLMEKGEHEVEVRMLRAGQSPFHALLSLSLLYDDAGTPIGMVGYSLDISERKHMEDALREREADLAHAQAIAHLGSWRLDIASEELTWSEETCRIFGFQPGTRVSLQESIDRIHPEDRDRVLAAWNHALSGALKGAPYDIEHRIVVDGQVKWVHEQAELTFDAEGKPVLCMGSVQDITPIKAAQRATQHALEEAERLALVKSEFLANMSHEIRTPLNAVLGLAQIGRRENQGRQAGETCGRILHAGQHLLDVINDILDFSKIEAGKLGVENRPFQLDATVDDVMEMLAERAKAKGLALTVSFAPGMPQWVTGDPLRVRQVLANLLSNAVKFTERGEVTLRVAREGDKTWFRVIDTGIGLSEEQLARLFTPFEQADSSTTRRYGGTGLGLAISRNLAQLMGGDITVESRLGEGCAFTLALPLPVAEPRVAHAPAQAAQNGHRLAHLRVLAAEDVEVNRYILEDLLLHEGAHVVFAENGQQALDRLNELGVAAFDVVLMDVQMPVMDGHEASRRIHEIAPALPIIGVTAHALSEEGEKCLASGMVEHITKPIDNEKLVTAIRRWVAPVDMTSARGAALHKPDSVAGEAPGPAAETPVEGVIDWPALLAHFKHRRDFVERLTATAYGSHAETPEKLRQAAQLGDMEAAAFLAHSIKGMAGNLKAQGVHAVAARVETAARAGDPDAAAQLLALAAQVDRLLAELARGLGPAS